MQKNFNNLKISKDQLLLIERFSLNINFTEFDIFWIISFFNN